MSKSWHNIQAMMTTGDRQGSFTSRATMLFLRTGGNHRTASWKQIGGYGALHVFALTVDHSGFGESDFLRQCVLKEKCGPRTSYTAISCGGHTT